MNSLPENFLLFLGTSGARFSMMYQMRASGGMWIRINKKNLVIDPGPGALVKICEMLPDLDPTKIDAIILTHRHIDHSNDLNVLVESMTFGGRTRRGTIVIPEDSLTEGSSILLEHLRKHIERLYTWQENKDIDLDDHIRIRGKRLIHHGVECFGFELESETTPIIGLISDTRLEDNWLEHFSRSRILIANITLLKRIERIDHLSIEEVPYILRKLNPELMLINHMGTSILEEGPDNLTKALCTPLTRVIAARDGMVVDLDKSDVVLPGNNNDRKIIERIQKMVIHRGKRYKPEGRR